MNRTRRLITLGAVLLTVSGVAAQDPYTRFPDWTSGDTQVSTGAALVDLNRDGWLDLVVANGNDIQQQHVAVYYNQGDGEYPALPDWESADSVYNGQLDVADVNGDGWPDVAVATLGTGSTLGPIARVYFNNLGTLSSTPDWSADVIGNAFGCGFGDVNNDGRPDLAVATGWQYGTQNFYPNYVYVNTGATLETTASWASADDDHTKDAKWYDVNGDGWLDLVMAGAYAPGRIYRNLGGVLETAASWQTTDVNNQLAMMTTLGDVTGDGWPELFLADRTSGRFRQYDGLPGGFFSTTASWTYTEGDCSAVALADINTDGMLDLATGGWWDRTRLFLNSGTGLPTSPPWNSAGTSVVEKICFGDIDKNGLRPDFEIFDDVPPQQHLFWFPLRPIQQVTLVELDGQPLGPHEYHVNYELGWIMVGRDVQLELRVDFTVSSKLDMAVTNWDSDKGNHAYYNRLVVRGDANCDGRLDFGDINPFVSLLTGSYHQYFPDCDGETFCDMNEDGKVDFADINPFVAALTNP